jgi:hypothetical protein
MHNNNIKYMIYQQSVTLKLFNFKKSQVPHPRSAASHHYQNHTIKIKIKIFSTSYNPQKGFKVERHQNHTIGWFLIISIN